MKYTTRHEEKRRYRIVILLITLIFVGGLIWWSMGDGAAEPEWDVCYEMCNKNIEWTWAGKN